MAEYWGAQAYWPSAGPNGRLRYVMDQRLPPRFQFTSPQGEQNTTTIETVRRQIMNQHPEDISALADQWQNAYNLLSSIRQQILDQSTTLYHEHWKHAQARDAFLKSGPGTTLTYLDEWMTAVSNNVTALRAMVGIATSSRTDMTNLWNEYVAAVDEARHLDGGERTKTFFQVWKSWEDADRDEAINDLRHTQEEYNRKAQDLAYRVAGEYFETFSNSSSGFGPPFTPMDAVLNVVGHEPWRMPGTPPGAAPVPPPVLPAPLPARVAPGGPGQLQQQVLASIQPPPAVDVAAPPSGVSSPGAAIAPLVPGGSIAPPLGARGAAGAVAAGAAAPPPGTAGLAAGAKSPVAGGLPGGLPGAIRDGVLRSAPARPGLGAGAPPPAISRPRRPSDVAGEEERAPAAPSSETNEAFGRPATPATPPVLQGPRPPRKNEGRLYGPTMAGAEGDVDVVPPGAAPPVLKPPARNPSRQPPPSGPGARRGKGDRGRRRSPQTGAEWIGAESSRAGASAPVLDTPAAGIAGSAVSGLEEVPARLRSTAAAPARSTGAPPGAVAPELTGRRAASASGPAAADGIERADDTARIVTDEEAFSVQTPGGGVIAKRPEVHGYRPEPPTALGGG
jgi:hypothetical protein